VIKRATNQDLSDDFEDGFAQAYVDLSQNKKGVLPPVPPPRYWHAYYRAPIGRQHVYEWYAGYEMGTQEAFRAGVHTWTQVMSLASLQCGGPVPEYVSADHVVMQEPPAMVNMAPAFREEPQAAPLYAVRQAVAARPPVPVRPPIAPHPPAAMRPPVVSAAHVPAHPPAALRPEADYRFTAVQNASNPTASYRQGAGGFAQAAAPESDYRASASAGHLGGAASAARPMATSSASVRGY
jgi:hypothetical protein